MVARVSARPRTVFRAVRRCALGGLVALAAVMAWCLSLSESACVRYGGWIAGGTLLGMLGLGLWVSRR
ncbi:hypothetical protein F1536_12180 [Achromobacter xylosoxidans]|uniref:hypothetical protein n=1 Tax=Alcaligenes xylosoxydans xylosoxydans TaxID=85698 RepID=UPI00047D058C|nr:hypothetical protein [Achromobacter xylosoxidans]KAA5926310.1 hypothetical protein F1536_12180 [Achromobacter xylosoxidans]KMJ92507.1 hypothetical protein ACH58_07755 [Achromobacter xylosoxidans]MBK1981520.1 hypothetical protein [Achromobacter xylosoxidans]MCH4594983.1 hypothetical protein [Achromobacter xylosoxidans]MCZ8440338.1 hypothetical protein [Achromobacter xylosoxidans]